MADVQTDSEDRKNPSLLDDQELFLRLKGWFQEDRRHMRDWLSDMREDYDFVAGEQWTEEDKAALKEQLRPVVTFNRIGPVIDNVAGMEVNNRQEVRYIPRTEGDEQPNEILTGAADWVRDECDAEDEESDAFVDNLICGMGWTETRLEYTTDPAGNVLIERVDPGEMVFDCTATKRNLGDAGRVFRWKDMDWPSARAMFPEFEDDDLHAAWAETGQDEAESGTIQSEQVTRNYAVGTSDIASKRKTCRIVEAQWWELEPFYTVTDPQSGQTQQLSPADHTKLKKRADVAGISIQSVKQVKRVYKRAFLGSELLESGDGPCKEDFTYKCMTGKRDRNKGTWYGLVRSMKDPQRWANKFFSTLMHNLSTQGKGIMAEVDAFDDWRKAEDDWAQPDRMVKTASGAIAGGKIMPKPAGTFPAQVNQMMQFALQSIRDASGVNTELMGLADRQQAGVLEAERKKSAMTILAGMFDSLRRYRKEQGRVLLYFITTYLSDERLIRITGQQGAQYVPLVKQPDTLKYDVIVDDSPSSPNQKEMTWILINQMMPILSRLNIPGELWIEILKQSPLPSSFVTNVQQILEKQAQQPPPPDPNMVKAQAQAQAANMSAQVQAQSAQQQAQIDQQTAAQQADLEAQKAQQEMMLESMKADHAMKLSQQQQAADLILQAQQQEFEQRLETERAQHQAQLAAFTAREKAKNSKVKPRVQ